MDPVTAVLEPIVVDPDPIELIEPAASPTRALIRSALAERPWAIRRSWLAMMLNASTLPMEPPTKPKPDMSASSWMERMGGAMVGPTAVIPVYGLITQRSDFWSWLFGGTSIDDLRNAIREALADPAATSVVLDISSPGGSVDGIPEFATELRGIRGGTKPIVAVVNPLAASAAYWIGCSVDQLVMTPSGEVGSIGVYAAHEDDSGALEMAGIKITLISAGRYKTEGNPFEPLADEAKANIQDQVDTFYAMFLGDVAKGRGVTSSIVASSYGQGRTMLARQALAAGMVDRIDTLEATVARLGRTAKPTSRGALTSIPADHGRAAVAAMSISQPDRAWNQRMKGKKR